MLAILCQLQSMNKTAQVLTGRRTRNVCIKCVQLFQTHEFPLCFCSVQGKQTQDFRRPETFVSLRPNRALIDLHQMVLHFGGYAFPQKSTGGLIITRLSEADKSPKLRHANGHRTWTWTRDFPSGFTRSVTAPVPNHWNIIFVHCVSDFSSLTKRRFSPGGGVKN